VKAKLKDLDGKYYGTIIEITDGDKVNTSGKELYFNCPGWGKDFRGPFVIVDGKQRLQAVREFMGGKIKVFGSYIYEYKNKPDIMIARFSWNIAALETRKEVLEWYLNFNSGGTVHTQEELQKVRNMLDEL
jgi:hypothetical protein